MTTDKKLVSRACSIILFMQQHTKCMEEKSRLHRTEGESINSVSMQPLYHNQVTIIIYPLHIRHSSLLSILPTNNQYLCRKAGRGRRTLQDSTSIYILLSFVALLCLVLILLLGLYSRSRKLFLFRRNDLGLSCK